MVQDFIEDVALNWELRLIFLDRVYSHSLARPPTHHDEQRSPTNEYLSSLLGEEEEAIVCYPDDRIIQKAGGILDLIEGHLAYTRIDVIVGRLRRDQGDDEKDGRNADHLSRAENPKNVEFWRQLGFVVDDGRSIDLVGAEDEDDKRETNDDRVIHLMEVELIEPALYLTPKSAEVLGNGILARMK